MSTSRPAENLLSEHYEYASADPLALQDELVRAIAGVLAPEVLKLERERAVRRSEAEESAYDFRTRHVAPLPQHA